MEELAAALPPAEKEAAAAKKIQFEVSIRNTKCDCLLNLLHKTARECSGASTEIIPYPIHYDKDLEAEKSIINPLMSLRAVFFLKQPNERFTIEYAECVREKSEEFRRLFSAALDYRFGCDENANLDYKNKRAIEIARMQRRQEMIIIDFVQWREYPCKHFKKPAPLY